MIGSAGGGWVGGDDSDNAMIAKIHNISIIKEEVSKVARKQCHAHSHMISDEDQTIHRWGQFANGRDRLILSMIWIAFHIMYIIQIIWTTSVHSEQWTIQINKLDH